MLKISSKINADTKLFGYQIRQIHGSFSYFHYCNLEIVSEQIN